MNGIVHSPPSGRDDTGVQYVQPVSKAHTGKRGQPRKDVNVEFLVEAMSSRRQISISKLALALGIHRNTLSARLKEAGVLRKFSALHKSDLDKLVKGFRSVKPDSGVRYLIGFLRSHGIRIQKHRVFASIRRVDGLGRALRQRTTIHRRTYKVSRPNALWHLDGHHKLILWGFVIHGIVDGYSRTVSRCNVSLSPSL
jgi:hypothetical protein